MPFLCRTVQRFTLLASPGLCFSHPVAASPRLALSLPLFPCLRRSPRRFSAAFLFNTMPLRVLSLLFLTSPPLVEAVRFLCCACPITSVPLPIAAHPPRAKPSLCKTHPCLSPASRLRVSPCPSHSVQFRALAFQRLPCLSCSFSRLPAPSLGCSSPSQLASNHGHAVSFLLLA